ncbi:MAG: TetR/AcrR family transcriptional regulator [Aestuariivirgaceae bacterium]
MTKRKPRHQSLEHRDLTTAQAILAVAEDMSANVGANHIKLADIAAALGIEPPAIYRHYRGLKGVIAALGEVALKAELETFEGIEDLPFSTALKTQAERCFDLYMTRPGIARFLMIDLADPRGVHVFDENANLDLIRQLFACEQQLLERGIKAGVIRPMSVTSFVAARLGPAIAAFAMKDMNAQGSKADVAALRNEYLQTVLTGLCTVEGD